MFTARRPSCLSREEAPLCSWQPPRILPCSFNITWQTFPPLLPGACSYHFNTLPGTGLQWPHLFTAHCVVSSFLLLEITPSWSFIVVCFLNFQEWANWVKGQEHFHSLFYGVVISMPVVLLSKRLSHVSIKVDTHVPISHNFTNVWNFFFESMNDLYFLLFF